MDTAADRSCRRPSGDVRGAGWWLRERGAEPAAPPKLGPAGADGLKAYRPPLELVNCVTDCAACVTRRLVKKTVK